MFFILVGFVVFVRCSKAAAYLATNLRFFSELAKRSVTNMTEYVLFRNNLYEIGCYVRAQ